MTAPSIRSYMQIFSRFGLTWHRKVNFSTFSGKLTFQSTRNGPQNLPFCPGSLQDTFIIFSSISHQHIFRKYFSKKNDAHVRPFFFVDKMASFFFGFSMRIHGGRGSGRQKKNAKAESPGCLKAAWRTRLPKAQGRLHESIPSVFITKTKRIREEKQNHMCMQRRPLIQI